MLWVQWLFFLNIQNNLFYANSFVKQFSCWQALEIIFPEDTFFVEMFCTTPPRRPRKNLKIIQQEAIK